MAFSIDGLQQVGPGGAGPRMWVYTSAEALAAVQAANFLDPASSLLGVRDVITVVDTATPATTLVNVLTNSAAGVVTISAVGVVIAE